MKRFILCMLLLAFVLPLPVHTLAAGNGVAVGGIHILMTGVTGDALEGAVFRLYREVEPRELTDQSIPKEVLPVGKDYRIMTLVPVWSDRSLTGERVDSVATDETGQAALYGVPYGTYYLVEEQAPEGFNRITKPIRLTIHKYSHLTEADDIRDDAGEVIDNTLHIINVRYTLPDTGGLEQIRLTAGLVGITFSAVSLLLLNRRRR